MGIATSVRLNTEAERYEIVRALKLDDEAAEVWRLSSVQKRHPDWKEFKKFWTKYNLGGCSWRCPPSQFNWFANPIPLKPSDLFPPSVQGEKSPDIIKMHSSYQAIRPDQALSVVENSLDSNSPILTWLSTGHFDEKAIAEKTKKFGKPINPSGGSASAPSAPYVRYLRDFEIRVSPRHFALQRRFMERIQRSGASSVTCDTTRIDIQFELDGHGHVLAEVKPCDKTDARFAIRTAMGQLLDYKQRHSNQAQALLVVLEIRPSNEDINLALSNGFGVSYPKGTNFILRWPKNGHGRSPLTRP
jgi:hypothetical protein